MFYAEDVARLVKALKLAAAMQQQEDQENAFAVAVLAPATIGLDFSA